MRPNAIVLQFIHFLKRELGEVCCDADRSLLPVGSRRGPMSEAILLASANGVGNPKSSREEDVENEMLSAPAIACAPEAEQDVPPNRKARVLLACALPMGCRHC